MSEVTTGGDVNLLIARPYQSQLEEIAIRKNTIINLPTGSGKTFIAVRLITRFRDGLQKPWGNGGKRTFLVNNVPLVIQQQKVIKQMCPVNGVGAYSSEDGVDYWDKRKWDEELTKHQVIVMTCQIVLDMLTHGYIRIEDINLIIFDECHHAVEDHPMRMIMKHFEICPVHLQPRVLGLTATLLNANVVFSKVQSTLKELETTFHATIATVNELGEVLKYSTNPNELVQSFRSLRLTSGALEAMDILTNLQKYVIEVKLPVITGKALIHLDKGQQDITTDPKKDTPLTISKSIGTLGVDISSDVQYLGHLEDKVKLASKKLGVLNRVKRYFTLGQRLLLYKSQVWPHMECCPDCCYFWAGAPKYQIAHFDSVQQRAVKIVDDPILTSDLEPLSLRRDFDSLCIF
ncbi:LOW QUALITY PROTEIN: endoribonuclease Dcr-2-like [Aphomia sociella]